MWFYKYSQSDTQNPTDPNSVGVPDLNSGSSEANPFFDSFEEPFKSWAIKNSKDPIQEEILLNIYSWWKETNINLNHFTIDKAQESMARYNDHKKHKQIDAVSSEREIVYSPEEWNGWKIVKLDLDDDYDLAVTAALMGLRPSYFDYYDANYNILYCLRDEYNAPWAIIVLDDMWQITSIEGRRPNKENRKLDPIPEHKSLISDWLQDLSRKEPKLQFEFEEPYVFRFDNVEDSEIDNEIRRMALEPQNDYGLKFPLSLLDIETAYSNALSRLQGKRRSNENRYARYVGKAIAEAAWEADKYRSKNFNKKEFEKMSKQYGVEWLWNKIQENDEEFFSVFDFTPSKSLESFAEESGYEGEVIPDDIRIKYENMVLEEERDYVEEEMKRYLPWSMDLAISKELSELAEKDPIIPPQY